MLSKSRKNSGKKKSLVFLAMIIAIGSSYGQFSEAHVLSDSLKEISGLELINDTTFVAINDGGDEPRIYLLNKQGELHRSVLVENASNKDWEDLTTDGKHVYIADIGNNLCKRKKLRILKIKIKDIESKSIVRAEKIKIRYEDQLSYPPGADSIFYDSEAIAYVNDSIWIFTKPNSSPWQGESFIYKAPTEPGKYVLPKADEIFIGENGWWSDAITAIDYYDQKYYVLTYNRLMVGTIEQGILLIDKTFEFKELSQKESVIVEDKETVYIADENHRLLGGGKLYKLNIND